MVYAENEKSLAEGLFYFSCNHSSQVGSRSSLPSPIGDLEAMAVDKEPCSSEGNCQTQFEERCAYGSPLDADKKDPRGSGDLGSCGYLSANLDKGPICSSDMETDVLKRHNSCDDLDARGFKRARQDNCSSRSISQIRDVEADGIEDQLLKMEAQASSAEAVRKTIGYNGLDMSDTGNSGVSNSISNVNCMSLDQTNETEFGLPELPAEICLPPHFIERRLHPNETNLGEGTPLPFYDKYFRKSPLVGPYYQVDVPPMNNNNSRSSDKFVGTCIIPMPEADTFSPSSIQLRDHVFDCCCPDRGSIRCVRQHVTEAREHARIAFGPEKFTQLGFYNMGEDVAKGWTAEEEQLFHEVVFANPASGEKNFWNILARVFTTRSSKELVSYYFNVYMLRKRAEQNRLDPRNVDSDNDEWQDGDDGHYVMDGAGVCPYGSPVYRSSAYATDHEEDQEGSSDEDDEKETCDDFDVASESTEQGPFNMCNRCIDSYNEDDSDKETYEHFPTCSESNESRDVDSPKESIITYKSGFIPSEMTMKINSEDMDDDSHTLFEGHHRGVYSSSKDTSVSSSAAAENGSLSICKSAEECKASLNIAATDHGYLSGPCDSKTWDVGYFAGSGDVVEFLPTCYVIEEVFGKGSFDNTTTKDATKDGSDIF